MEKKDLSFEESGGTKSTGPTYTRYKCCSEGCGCNDFHSWTEVGECYDRGGHLAKGKSENG